ncbi:unnamed protein product [Rotaria socialis]|uniref:Uncharacterized protein n=1 Tax=Rotaria socialis TaxID=392032 RepID=A0A817NCI7_9BILA|nr:unnamed protein product [Rotaria socialis]CAF4358416.1 unnamed protein product [Rotaria socialis]CAF4642746.1 unnamed protein product [Rotaria socialis]
MATSHPLPGPNDGNLETFSVVWLDAAINDTKFINAQRRIGKSIHYLKTFTKVDDCEKYLKSMHEGDRIVLIDGVTEELDEVVVLVLSIQDKSRSQRILDQPLALDIFDTRANQGKSSTELNGQFVHSQLLINCLMRMRSTPNDKADFVSFLKKAYAHNESNLTIVREFERDYTPNQALHWYTRPCFLFQILNKALRVQNVDVLYLIRFFIRDVGRQLEEYKLISPITLYRYQLMSKEELDALRNSVGQLISVNSFFSTSRDRDIAFFLLSAAGPSNNDCQKVIFEIHADPRLESIKAFADITSFSAIQNEEEVLMTLGSIFRLVSIRRHDLGWVIQMRLCSENDHDLKPIIDKIKYDVYGDDNARSNAGTYGHVLSLMGKYSEAEKYFNLIRSELCPDDKKLGACYQNLAILAAKKGNHDKSLELEQKALAIKREKLGSDDPHVADVLCNMSGSYYEKGDYKQALETCNNALAIYKRTLGEDDLKIAGCYLNMGSIHEKIGKNIEALEYFHKALSIQEKHLPSDHYSLGQSHQNIGMLQYLLGHSEVSLEHFKKALQTYEKSCASQDINFAYTYYGMGCVYISKKMFSEALMYSNKARDIFLKQLPPSHPSVFAVERNIQHIKRFTK